MHTQLLQPAVPLEIRWLLVIAGWLLPPALRRDWLREWYAEFWHSPERGRRQMRVRAFGAFPDAWALLRQNYGIVRRIQDSSRSRTAPLLSLALLMTAATLLTNGFSRGRRLLFPDDSADLVLIAQPVPFLGGHAHIPAAQAEAWLQRSRTVVKLGRWYLETQIRGDRRVLVCRADPVASALLSEALAKPPCERIEPAGSTPPQFAGVVAQLRNRASIHEAEQELAETASLRKGWLRPSIVSLAGIRRAPLIPVGLTLLGLMFLSLLPARSLTRKAWIWAASKVALSFALIAGVWIERVARAPFTETAGIPSAWSAGLYLIPVIAGYCAAWWLRRDVHRHCRVCYRPLTMPVSVGMTGRSPFEPCGTEYLCDAGHGGLLVGPMHEPMAEGVWAAW